MEVIKPEIRNSLFSDDRPVYTKLRDEMSARYLGNASISDSIVADGCIVDANVSHSVLFRGVRIGKGASVKTALSCKTAWWRKAWSWKTAYWTSRPSSRKAAN